ncbi:MAG: NAD(P)H-dependent oxidoreductase [Rhodospirillales bacterium]|nr:NAD(P)H-dependent oxidoreductase [Rhodospirillales bacterium]
MTRISIIQGHPTAGEEHFCHALARAYAEGAVNAGHEVKAIIVADLDFPVLRSKQDWDSGQAPPAIAATQETIRWSQHLLIIHPLWIGSMPALLKAFLEQALRPGFAMSTSAKGGWTKLLSGRSAQVVVTMGMPGFIYRWYFGAHGLNSLTQSLSLVGIAPCRSTLIGMVEAMDDGKRRRWLDRLRVLGGQAA